MNQSKLLGGLVEQFVPDNLTEEVLQLLEDNGFKALQECVERRGAWYALNPRTGHELVVNQFHVSVLRPTGLFQEMSSSFSFGSGRKAFYMEEKEVIKRIPLREDSDTE